MNKQEIKRKKINIIDILIILFIIAAAAGGIYRLNLSEKINIFENKEKFELEFLILDIQSASQDFLTPGESFYINIQDTKIGEIKEILEVRPAEAFVSTTKGDIKKTESPNRIDVIGVMSATGKKADSDSACFINGNIFTTCGKEFLIHTGKLEVTITITSVKKVN